MIKQSASFGKVKLLTIIPCNADNFYWNVTGPMFQTLHLVFEAQHNLLALGFDLLAERYSHFMAQVSKRISHENLA